MGVYALPKSRFVGLGVGNVAEYFLHDGTPRALKDTRSRVNLLEYNGVDHNAAVDGDFDGLLLLYLKSSPLVLLMLDSSQ